MYGFAEALADTPLRNFWISLDSPFDAVHEQMRGFKGGVAGIAGFELHQILIQS